MKTESNRFVKRLALVLVMALYSVPFYILLTTALKRESDLSSKWTFPGYFYTENFAQAWQNAHLGRAFLNNTIILVCSLALLVVLGAAASYPLARYKTKLNRFMYVFFIAAMIVPPLTILVPLYKFYVALHAMDTYWGIILIDVTFQLPMAIFLYTGFIGTLPRELDEAALLDGCSRFSVFFKVLFPLLKPVTASVIILSGVNIWNDYQFSVFFLQQTNMKTFTVSLASFFSANNNHIMWVAAGSLLGSLPVIAAYLLLQKYFVSGLSAGAVKG